MAHVIPLSVTSSAAAPPVNDLIAEIFWVTVDGDTVEMVDRVPVQDGLAVYRGPALTSPQLRWAIRVSDVLSGEVLLRSGPLQRLPGPPSTLEPTGQVSIFRLHRSNFQLDHFAEHFGPVYMRLLPAPLQFQQVEFETDDDGHYVVTVRGRLEMSGRILPFVYQRALRIRPGSDPGRPARVVTTLTDGVAKIRGANVRPHAAALDETIMTTVQKLFWMGARYAAGFGLYTHGSPFEATTVSLNTLALDPPGTSEGIDAVAYLAAGAITGGVTQQEPPEAALND